MNSNPNRSRHRSRGGQGWTGDKGSNGGPGRGRMGAVPGHSSDHFSQPRRTVSHDAARREDSRRGRDRGNWKPGFGFRKLLEMSKMEPSQIMITFSSETLNFDAFLSKNIEPDHMVLFVKCLSVLCKDTFDNNKLRIFLKIFKVGFLDSLQGYLFKLPFVRLSEKHTNSLFWEDVEGFWCNVFCLCEQIIDLSPSTAVDMLRGFMEAMRVTLENLRVHQEERFTAEFNSAYVHLVMKFTIAVESIEKINKIKETVKSGSAEAQQALQDLQPPDVYWQLPVMPTAAELTTREPVFLRPNIVAGAYAGVEHYLDVQFRLLREDFIAPLRTGIQDYLRDPTLRKYNNVKIYREATFIRYTAERGVAGILVAFDQKKYFNPPNQKKDKVFKSKRFLYGSLVCFTQDKFNTIYFGTVVSNDHVDSGVILVQPEEFRPTNAMFGPKFVMVESEVFFPPYYHILKAWQRPSLREHFPMKKYIVDIQADREPPAYIARVPQYRLFNNACVSLLHENTWPSADALKLNPSQYAAYKAALTNEFVTIQGPPGTGKTFVGLKIARTLVRNKKACVKSPILIVCFTNHALDQFLEGLLPETENLVRIGGQSKNENLNMYNIKEFRKKVRRPHRMDFHNMLSGLGTLHANLEVMSSREKIINLASVHDSLHIDFQLFFLTFDKLKLRLLDCEFSIASWLLMSDKGLQPNLTGEQKTQKNTTTVADFEESDESEGDARDDYDDDIHRPQMHEGFDTAVTHTFSTFGLPDIRMKIDKIRRSIENDKYDDEEMQYLNQVLILLHNQYQHLKMRLARGAQGYRAVVYRGQPAEAFNVEERWSLYWQWLEITHNNTVQANSRAMERYYAEKDAYDEMEMAGDLQTLKSVDVIGMTTSGAARLQGLVRALQSQIVIVEEAAEVMESHIVVSLTQHCEHVILIGDHQQLKPSTSWFRLAREFNFDISLFERMVNNGRQCHRLDVQHRMRPDIAALICPAIYPILHNHASVTEYPHIKGLHRNVYFLDHQHNEQFVESISSRMNQHEATFVLNFAKYLIQQGYEPDKITILTTYKGQMFHLKNESKNISLVSRIYIQVLDNYQGEENDIVILSLVRSNVEENIGFLATANRVCVGLSRAKHGFYVIGDMSCLAKKSQLWQQVRAVLEQQQSIGKSLNLLCHIHNTTTEVSIGEDFHMLPEGGCSRKCELMLSCGHYCKRFCHPTDREHATNKCTEKCQRLLCSLEHPCPDLCHKPCQPCGVMLTKLLPCSHEKRLPCHKKPEDAICEKTVPVELPLCKHQTNKPCYLEVDLVICPHPCEDRLECGHACPKKCHKKQDPEHLEYLCMSDCARINKGCTQEHACKLRCHETCIPCPVPVRKKRSQCNHTEQVKCHEDVDASPCFKACTKSMQCGHHCKRKCHEACIFCEVKVQKSRSCGHVVETRCDRDPELELCRSKCERLLPCGHKCPRRCCERCDSQQCRQLVDNPYPAICQHRFSIPCNLTTLPDKFLASVQTMKYCKEACGVQLKGCDHLCQGSCGECRMGRLHLPCQEACGNVLVCGHSCSQPCREVCPPCQKPCTVRCKHSKCPNTCGIPCVSCKEECDRKCKHVSCKARCGQLCTARPCGEPCQERQPCGHQCRGLCGELCPNVCNKCQPEHFPQILFGDEDEEDARFIKLADCSHVVEVSGLDMWLSQKQESGGSGGPEGATDQQVKMPVCPYCKAGILNTPRYANLIKKALVDVNQIKRKIFGTNQNTLRHRLSTALKELASADLTAINRNPSWKLIYSNIINTAEKATSSKFSNKLKCSDMEMAKISSQCEILITLGNVYKPKGKPNDYVVDQMDFLLSALKSWGSKISTQQAEDFNNELTRTERMIQADNYLVTIENLKTYILLSKQPFNKKIDALVKEELKRVKSVVTDAERKMIVSAMGFKQGHWYKCKNGHPYCIANCGGATMIGQCPECKCQIGGTNYQLVAGNAHDPRMDGSRYPAWSEQANMVNYHF